MRNFKKVYPYDIDFIEEDLEKTKEEKKDYIRKHPGMSNKEYAEILWNNPKKWRSVPPLIREIEIQEINEQISDMDRVELNDEIQSFISTMLGYYNREELVGLWEKYNLKTMPLEDKVNNSSTFGLLSLESKEIDEEGNNLLTYICHDKTFKKVDIDDELILQHPTTEQFVDQEVTYKVKEIIDEFDGILTLKIQEEWREEEAKEISSYEYCSGYVNPRPVILQEFHLALLMH